MITMISEIIRRSLGPSARRGLNSVVGPLLSPLGSIHGAKTPSDTIALTFDDGPDPDVTPKLLDLLRDRGVHATFFVLTDKAAACPLLLQRIAEEGHEIGLHFDRHDRLTEMSIGDVRSRMRAARHWLECAVGPVTLFRPPFGAQNLSTYLVARAEGLEVVCWGIYAEDWVEQTATMAANKVLGPIRAGDIVLMHDGLEVPEGETPPTFDRVKMVEIILDGLAARSLFPDTVGNLVSLGGRRFSAWFRR